MLDRIRYYIRNRAKPIKGAIASAITYFATGHGLDLDFIEGVDEPALLAAIVFALVVERSGPVHGFEVDTPEVDASGRVRYSVPLPPQIH